MDSQALADLVRFGTSERMDSLLVTRHGRIVAEAYYAPFRAGQTHPLNSATKAVTGTLIGIALKNGLLDSLDHRVVEFFSHRTIANLDDKKQAITVQHLLNMTSGLQWVDGADDIAMSRSMHWEQYVLDRPMARAPGTSFNYNSGGSHLLSAIMRRLTGDRPLDYAKAQLFAPLGITNLIWTQDHQGTLTGGTGLLLLPRDMAKIGYLYLRRGNWEGRQILPMDWADRVSRATVEMQDFVPNMRYANQFWVTPDQQVYMAVGYQRQLIVVIPALDIVVVATGKRDYSLLKLMNQITDATKSSQPLPENVAARLALERSIADVAANNR